MSGRPALSPWCTLSCTPAISPAPGASTPVCAAGGRSGRHAAGSYLALELGERAGGGIVECPTERSLWLPYVEVPASRWRPIERAGWGRRGAARAARGPGRLAQRDRHAAGGEIGLLAAQALAPLRDGDGPRRKAPAASRSGASRGARWPGATSAARKPAAPPA